jgi:hypothetical protein
MQHLRLLRFDVLQRPIELDVGVLFNFGLWLLSPLAPEELL